MAYINQQWFPLDGPGIGRRGRRGGTFQAYVPELLSQRELLIPNDLTVRAGHLERKLGTLAHSESALGIEGVFRFLMRSEAISSSRIEGIAPAADKIAIEELKGMRGERQGDAPAQLVARNISILRDHLTDLATQDEIEISHIVALNTDLLGLGDRAGLRTVQNWIGGHNSSPLEADFVPPPAAMVEELMADLVRYLSGALHGGLIQAGIVHAQFETIHPFEDGNGRVGRALLQLVLVRRGLLASPSLPVSLVLGTWSQRYIAGLTAFRHPTPAGVNEWLGIFFDAVEQAVVLSAEIIAEVTAIKEGWIESINDRRKAQGMRKLRNDSTEYRVIDYLPTMPAIDVPFVAEVLEVSQTAAQTALQSLAESGVVRRKSIGRRAHAYVATDLVDTITWEDRKLASTQFDTAASPPQGRAVPGPPA